MAPRRKGKRVEMPDGVRVFGKAGNREGSVHRQADGRWCATWWVPGEKRPRKATGKTQQEAIVVAKRREQAGLDLGGLGTVGRLAEWWLHNVHRQAVRPSSWAKSEDRVRKIKATLGDLPVVDLDYRVVTEWQATLARTLAPRTVRHHRQTLAQVVDEAVKMGALLGNPVRSVKPLRVTESDGVALDRDQTKALLEAVEDHRLGVAVALLFLQGLARLGGARSRLGRRRPRCRHCPRAAGVGLRRRPGPAARATQDRGRPRRALADAHGRAVAGQAA
jgi:hypothetical protein